MPRPASLPLPPRLLPVLPALLLLCVPAAAALAQPAGPAPEAATLPQADARFEEGKRRVQLGEALFAEGKHESALKEFERAYGLLEGLPQRAALHYNIGLCHERMGRPESAAGSYRRYLAEAGADAEDRASVEQALAALDAAAAAVDQTFADAKQHVERGEALYESGDFNAALAEFERAYGLLEGHPKRFYVLYNIGRCQERLFRYDLAMQYYHRYLDEAGPEAEDRAGVRATVGGLEALLGTLDIESNVRAEVWVGNRHMGFAPGSVLVPGGQHVLELRAAGYEAVKRQVQLTARESQTHSFTLTELSNYEGLHSAYFWTGTALTLVTLGTGLAVGYAAKQKDDEGQARPAALNQDTLSGEIEDLTLTADILLGSAGLLAVGTGLLFFMTDWEGDADDSGETAGARIAPALLPGGAGVTAWGRF